MYLQVVLTDGMNLHLAFVFLQFAKNIAYSYV
jgi:hypothetical protein